MVGIYQPIIGSLVHFKMIGRFMVMLSAVHAGSVALDLLRVGQVIAGGSFVRA
jgi:hypothetical protein